LTYRDHIEQLAAELGTALWFNSWSARAVGSDAFGDTGHGPVVHLLSDDIATVRDYTRALHELGHCATLPKPFPRVDRCTPAYILEYEIKAWEWALEHAELGFDAGDAAWGITSYMLGTCIDTDHAPAFDFIKSLGISREAYAERVTAELGDLALAA
jgi:hypothetical protein